MDQVENKAVEQKAVETTTQTESPQVEAQTTEEQTPKGQATPEEVPDEIPANEQERRRAFQEQRLEIKRLKEESRARQQSESAFAPFRAAPAVDQSAVNVQTYTDPLTGETNWAAYDQAVNARIQRAEQLATMANQTVEEKLDERDARQKYPDLFADPEVEQEIADRWFASKMRGETYSVSEIADRVAKRFAKAVSKAEKSGAEKALEQVSPKEQAALSVQSQTSAPNRQAQSDEEYEKLRLQSRGGRLASDTDSTMAIAYRMKNIPWANK